ncbi:MAG: STAS domain-containing protein [Acidobacteriaceae bacterium]
MEGKLDRDTKPTTLRIGGELGIDSAAQLQACLLEALILGEPLQLEIEAVRGVDLTALQLLTAAERTARARGVSWVRVGAVPESLRRTAEEAGWERVPFAGDVQ